MSRTRSERGASLVMVAMALFVLVGGSAIAVDIGALWLDRSADQKVTDSSAAAGALEAISAGGQEACEVALAYASVNTDDLGPLDASGCSAFPTACDPSVPVSYTPPPSGRYSLTVTHPVPNVDALMTSGIVGASGQAVDPADGEACERFAVEMTATRQSLFAQVLGFDIGTTQVHTVAKASIDDTNPPINLLVLDRTGCRTLAVEGNGGIIVDAVIAVDDDGNEIGLAPGIAAADSDGSAGCASDGVIDLNGLDSELRADGPTCAGQTGTHTVGAYTAGEGCGRVQTFAPGTPGCDQSVNMPACSPGSGGANQPNPVPTALTRRLTRAPVDHRYNCWTDYTNPPSGLSWATDALTGDQDIPGCTESDPDHIYDLIQTVGQNGPVGGFSDWTSLTLPCDIPSSHPPIILPPGDIRIDCPSFVVRGHVRITGNVVFDGDVQVTSSSGHLEINNSLGDPGWAFFRDGLLVKDGSGHLTFNYTAVYMSKTAQVAMSGGSGSLTWIAPDSGAFDDLALWSDSTSTQFWAGQANLAMEGVFFTPLATADYSGTSGQNQTNAQWIADRLLARGQGTLVVRPAIDRAVPSGLPITTLIR